MDNNHNQDLDVKIEVEAKAENPMSKDPIQLTTPEEQSSNEESFDYTPDETVSRTDEPQPGPVAEESTEEVDIVTEQDLIDADNMEAPEPNEIEPEASEVPQKTAEASPEPTPVESEKESKFTDDPTLTESNKKQFDVSGAQDARKDSDDEGGVMVQRTAGTHKNNDAAMEGGQLKAQPNMERDSKEGQFEMTGFTVEYKGPGGGLKSIQVRDYFEDLDTAYASINGDKYLMPMDNGGFKISTITGGAPIVSMNERQMYIYKDGNWAKS